VLVRQPNRRLTVEELAVLRRAKGRFLLWGWLLLPVSVLLLVGFGAGAPAAPGWQRGLMWSGWLLALASSICGYFLLTRALVLGWDYRNAELLRFAPAQVPDAGATSLELLPRSRIIWRWNEGPILPSGGENRLHILSYPEEAEEVRVRRIAVSEFETVHENRRDYRRLVWLMVFGWWVAAWGQLFLVGATGLGNNLIAQALISFVVLLLYGVVELIAGNPLEIWWRWRVYSQDKAEGIGLTFLAPRHPNRPVHSGGPLAHEVLLHSGALWPRPQAADPLATPSSKPLV
jgi:hypothetical protein